MTRPKNRQPSPRWPDRIACPTCNKDATRVDGHQDDPQYWCMSCLYSKVGFQLANRTSRDPIRSDVPRDPDVDLCLCGCGEHVLHSRSIYRAGHDAKHLRKLVDQVLSGEIEYEAALDRIPSTMQGELVHWLTSRKRKQRSD